MTPLIPATFWPYQEYSNHTRQFPALNQILRGWSRGPETPLSVSAVLSVLPLILSTGNIKGTLGLKDFLCPLKHTGLFYPPSPDAQFSCPLPNRLSLYSNEGSCFSHPTHLLFPCLSPLLSAPTVAVEITHFTDPTPPGQLVPTAVVQKAIKIKHSSAMNHKPEQISEVI